MNRLQHIPTKEGCQENSQHLSCISRKEILDSLLNIRENLSSFFHGYNDGRKVIICQNHVRGTLRYFCTCNAHTDTDIGCLQSWCVIDTITCHGYNLTLVLPRFDNSYLMLRRNSGIDRVLANNHFEFCIRKLIELCTSQDMVFSISFFDDTQALGDSFCCILMVTGNHNRTNTSFLGYANSFCCFCTFWVNHTD